MYNLNFSRKYKVSVPGVSIEINVHVMKIINFKFNLLQLISFFTKFPKCLCHRNKIEQNNSPYRQNVLLLS